MTWQWRKAVADYQFGVRRFIVRRAFGLSPKYREHLRRSP